jgi:hypothetical protein
MGRGDWLHDVVLSSAARITDLAKVPQQLFDMTSDIDSGAVTYVDWMSGNSDVKGYGVTVKHKVGATLRMIVDIRFRLVDFKVWFPVSKTNYGCSNIFDPDMSPKAVVDAFWKGKDELDIANRLDVILHGFLDNDKPVVGRA